MHPSFFLHLREVARWFTFGCLTCTKSQTELHSCRNPARFFQFPSAWVNYMSKNSTVKNPNVKIRRPMSRVCTYVCVRNQCSQLKNGKLRTFLIRQSMLSTARVIQDVILTRDQRSRSCETSRQSTRSVPHNDQQTDAKQLEGSYIVSAIEAVTFSLTGNCYYY